MKEARLHLGERSPHPDPQRPSARSKADSSESPGSRGLPPSERESSEVWTIRRVLHWTTGHFEKKGVDAPRLTAEILLAHVLQLDRVRLYVDFERPLTASELSAFRALIARRLEGEPTQYLVGEKYFYNRRFQIDARVLVPRPETEMLVEAVLERLPQDIPFRLLDLCTGSGCIAVTVAAERPLAQVWAVDVSMGACEMARKNAGALGVEGRVTVLQGDLFSPVPPEAAFDAVVSNPPYISTQQISSLPKEVLREPRLALDGGADGLQIIRPLVDGARARLKPGGLLALEIAEDQGASVRDLLTQAGYTQVEIAKDFERRDRYAFATR